MSSNCTAQLNKILVHILKIKLDNNNFISPREEVRHPINSFIIEFGAIHAISNRRKQLPTTMIAMMMMKMTVVEVRLIINENNKNSNNVNNCNNKNI